MKYMHDFQVETLTGGVWHIFWFTWENVRPLSPQGSLS